MTYHPPHFLVEAIITSTGIAIYALPGKPSPRQSTKIPLMPQSPSAQKPISFYNINIKLIFQIIKGSYSTTTSAVTGVWSPNFKGPNDLTERGEEKEKDTTQKVR